MTVLTTIIQTQIVAQTRAIVRINAKDAEKDVDVVAEDRFR
ncbi:hypothetical protein [Metaclostridioides mangenotii]|nr:hypothetical protein [Clostridioides mangenotii]